MKKSTTFVPGDNLGLFAETLEPRVLFSAAPVEAPEIQLDVAGYPRAKLRVVNCYRL